MVTTSHLDEFTAKLQAMITGLDEKAGNVTRQVISYEVGKRYARLITVIYDTQRSAYGFVDLTNGDLLKAAGWKSPAKGKRGNIFAPNPLAGCTHYGMAYNR